MSEAGASAAGGREVLATGTVLLAGAGPVLVPTGPGVGPDHRMALELVGPDLPPPGSRVGVHGELRHRSLVVAGWRPDPGSTSVWSTDPASLSGVDPAVPDRIIDSVPDDWRVIRVGQAKTPEGAMVVDIEVEEATAEIREWLARQPPESVRMTAFIVDMPTDHPMS